MSGGGVELGGQVGCNEELKFFVKIQKKYFLFFWGGGRGGGGWVGVGVGGSVGGRGQGGCERRIEVLGKIHKKKNWGGR